MTRHLEASPPAYVPHDPSQTALYHVVADHLETFLASLDADPDARGLPAYVQREFYDYLRCGILAHGLLRLGYLEAGVDGTVPTGHDPLRNDAPELARPLAASVQQRIAFGERAGSRSGALAPALVLRARRQRSPVPAVRACGAFRSTPTPRSPPIGAISWSA
jgi:hypothetical protein